MAFQDYTRHGISQERNVVVVIASFSFSEDDCQYEHHAQVGK